MELAFMGPSPMEWIVIAALALIVLGPARLPEVARSVGRGIREMREALQGAGEEDEGDLSPLAVDDEDDLEDDYGSEGDVAPDADSDPEAELDSATEPEPPVELDSATPADRLVRPESPPAADQPR